MEISWQRDFPGGLSWCLSCLTSVKSDLQEKIKCTLIKYEDYTKRGGMTPADMFSGWAVIQKKPDKLEVDVGNSTDAFM